MVAGAFANGFVCSTLVVSGDAASNAYNIRTHELLYRSGLVAHVVVTVTNVPLAVILYELFKVVNRRLALLDACFILVATAIEVAGLANEFTPLGAADHMRVLFPPHSCRRWRICPATFRASATTFTPSSSDELSAGPGFVDTPLSARLLGDDLETRRQRLRDTLRIGRAVGPAELAALACT